MSDLRGRMWDEAKRDMTDMAVAVRSSLEASGTSIEKTEYLRGQLNVLTMLERIEKRVLAPQDQQNKKISTGQTY